MKKLILILLTLCLTACEKGDRYESQKIQANTWQGKVSYVEVCINGVIYYLQDRGIAPAFDKYSHVIECPEK